MRDLLLFFGLLLNGCPDSSSPQDTGDSGNAIECLSDADCGLCDVCEEGQCYATPGAAPECETDDDCPSQGVCVIEECYAYCD